MLSALDTHVRAAFAQFRNQRGQSEVLIILLLVFLIFLLASTGRVAMQ
jgi:hypothetical protein